MTIVELRTDGDRHECISWQNRGNGDMIYFQCPICDFLRQMDPRTGETKVIRRGDESALHYGSVGPVYRPQENEN